MSKYQNKFLIRLIHLIFFISIIFLIVYLSIDRETHTEINSLKEEKITKTDPDTATLKIIIVGDIMLGSNYPSSAYLPPNDGKDLLKNVKEIIQSADVSIGNLEGVLLSDEGKIKKFKDTINYYAFKSPDHYVELLKDAGFDVLNLANNHINDFGEPGINNTVKLLTENEIYFAGLVEYPYTIFTKNNLKIGFTGFAPNQGTNNINDSSLIKKIVSYLDSLCDIVIVSFHSGAEGATYNRVTRKTEYFLNENRGNPYEFARIAIDAGADLIFGHGPHVVRAIDLYKDRYIAYSLGNFATYRQINIQGTNGYAPMIELTLNANGKFLSGKIHSAIQKGNGPVLDKLNRAAKEIKRLTELDIPGCSLKITEDGLISTNFLLISN